MWEMFGYGRNGSAPRWLEGVQLYCSLEELDKFIEFIQYTRDYFRKEQEEGQEGVVYSCYQDWDEEWTEESTDFYVDTELGASVIKNVITVLNDWQTSTLKKKFPFFDFEDLVFKGKNHVKIQFDNRIKTVLYEDVVNGGNKKKYKKQRNAVIELIQLIFSKLPEEYCIILKYGDRWVGNKRANKALHWILKCNNVKKTARALRISKHTDTPEWFLKSALKGNSFVQFVFEDTKMVFVVTELMEIYVGAEREESINLVCSCVQKWNESKDTKMTFVTDRIKGSVS